MTAVVRRRVDADLDALVGVLTQTHALDGYPIGAEHVSAEWLSPPDEVAAWVAVVDGRAVGHVGLKNVAGSDGVVELTRMVVDPGSRGSGLAGALLDVADAHVRENTLEMVLVVAEKDTAAIALYEKRGWRETGRGTEQWLGPTGPITPVRYYTRD